MQPNFAKADQQFKCKETLPSTVIATDRLEIERGVRLSIECGFGNRGVYAITCLV